MATFDKEAPGGPGHVLTEDGALRLRTLREQLRLLSQLTKTRTQEEDDGATEAGMGELTFCLALLVGQADQVLAALSRPPRRDGRTTAGFMPAATEPAAAAVQAQTNDALDQAVSFGLRLDQIDALNRLVATLPAHGDVVAAAATTTFVDHTLPVIGHAIFDGAQAVRDILQDVETQALAQGTRATTVVREAHAAYAYGLGSPQLPRLLRRVRPAYATRLR